jgi:hypothetical protein
MMDREEALRRAKRVHGHDLACAFDEQIIPDGGACPLCSDTADAIIQAVAELTQKHSEECLRYAAQTGKPSCIAECRDAQVDLDRLRSDLAEAIRTRNLAQEASTRDLEAKRAAEGERDRLGLSYCVLEGQYETACQIITEERKELERLKADAEANEELICFILSSNKPWTGTLPKLEFAKNEIEIANAVARYQKGISRESQNKIEAHVEILKNLANALFPDSPLDSALAEFALDAMGACQVIRRLRADKKRLDWCERMARKYPGEVVNVIGAVIGANMRERIDAAMGGE